MNFRSLLSNGVQSMKWNFLKQSWPTNQLEWPSTLTWPLSTTNWFSKVQRVTTVTIWIPNTRIPDSMGVRYSNGKVTWLGGPFKYQTFWTINRLFSVRFSDHHLNTGPFDNWTLIYHLNTRLVSYSDGYCNSKNV